MTDFTYDLASTDPAVAAIAQVRLLANDVDEDWRCFDDAEIQAFLTTEGGAVKLAAAQAIDTIADDQALVAKVIKTQDLTTDGPRLADSLRKRADSLRKLHASDLDDSWGEFTIVAPPGRCRPPELTEWPTRPYC